MEGLPSFLVAFNVCAITFPRFAASAGLVWAVGRVMYQIGYGCQGPKGRSKGSYLSGVASLTLVYFPMITELTSSLVERLMACSASLWRLFKSSRHGKKTSFVRLVIVWN